MTGDFAGRWELPAGQQAVERAPAWAIKEAGGHLIVAHTGLDKPSTRTGRIPLTRRA
ncbi:hypothetical protein [Streptomyces sp. NBC_01530]|uniref:hypothetical protein n=1 Tax=Streptomyces sp. NBC_01530 TaxID=2903895 RepID=UPI00386524DA